MRPQQLAITKTPPRCGTYCLRLRLHDGATLEYVSSRAQTYTELIDALEMRILDVRRIARADLESLPQPSTQGDPPPDSPEDIEAHPWKATREKDDAD